MNGFLFSPLLFDLNWGLFGEILKIPDFQNVFLTKLLIVKFFEVKDLTKKTHKKSTKRWQRYKKKQTKTKVQNGEFFAWEKKLTSLSYT